MNLAECVQYASQQGMQAKRGMQARNPLTQNKSLNYQVHKPTIGFITGVILRRTGVLTAVTAWVTDHVSHVSQKSLTINKG